MNGQEIISWPCETQKQLFPYFMLDYMLVESIRSSTWSKSNLFQTDSASNLHLSLNYLLLCPYNTETYTSCYSAASRLVTGVINCLLSQHVPASDTHHSYRRTHWASTGRAKTWMLMSSVPACPSTVAIYLPSWWEEWKWDHGGKRR